jgi:hypothetical protein
MIQPYLLNETERRPLMEHIKGRGASVCRRLPGGQGRTNPAAVCRQVNLAWIAEDVGNSILFHCTFARNGSKDVLVPCKGSYQPRLKVPERGVRG